MGSSPGTNSSTLLQKCNTFEPCILGLFSWLTKKYQIRYTVVVVDDKELKLAEVCVSHLYKVTMTEYDNGAQHDMGTKFFDNEAEARAFCQE